MSHGPAPDEEPRFIGPLGYVLRSACYGGTRVDLIPFTTSDRSDLNERVYVRFRPAGGERYAVVAWEQNTEQHGIFPAVTVYGDLEEILAAYPALRERAAAFEIAAVRKFPPSRCEGRRRSVDGAVLMLPPFHRTPGLFNFGFGAEMPYIAVTPLEMDDVYHLLFTRTGYRRSGILPLQNAMARHRPLPPGLLELGPARSGFAVAMHPGGNSRAGFDGFPRFQECLAYAQDVHAASKDRSRLTGSTLKRATVGPTPGRTPSGLQIYTLQYLKGGAAADIVPFFLDGDDSPGQICVRYTSPEAGSHGVISWVRAGRWEPRLVVTPFEDRNSLVAAYPLLREAVAAAEAGETWRLPPFHRVQDVFQDWRCRGRPEVTVAPAEADGVCSLAFERRMPGGVWQREFVDAASINPVREEEHPSLREDLDYGERLFSSAGTVTWQKVLDRGLYAVSGESGIALQALPVRDGAGRHFLLIRRETDRPSFTLITWPEGEGACPVGAAGEYPGVEELLRSHPELEASLMCANQQLVMDCRHARPEGGA